MNSAKALKMLVLSLTGKCNFACRYCYAEEHPQDVISPDIAIRAVDLAAAGGRPFVLQFSGGEPLLAFPVLQEVVRYVQDRRIPALMQLQTNASLLDREKAAWLRSSRVGVGISLDGRPASNDRLRRLPGGQGTSRYIVRGAQCLAAVGMEIGITCVVAAENAGQLADVVEMAYYLGNVRRIGFDLLRRQGRGNRLTPPAAEAVDAGLRSALQTADRLGRQTGRKMLISQVERVEVLSQGRLSGFGHCHAMNGEAAFVDARGRIYACSSLVGDEDFRLGDVRMGIDAGRQQQVVGMIRSSMAFCRECPAFSLCGGGCFARWYGSERSCAYRVECAMKQACIEWFQEHREEGIEA